MSASPPAPPASDRGRFGLSRKALLLVAIAFGIGLLLFLLLWAGQRDDDDFFRAGSRPASQSGQVFEPLPTPDAAGDSRQEQERTLPGERDSVAGPEQSHGEIIEEATPEPVAPPAPPAPVAAVPDASARPIRSPRPEYPAQAMRRGERGTVLLQVQVDAQGQPTAVDVVQSSRSRTLDREAARAVRNWEFSPAMRGGRAVPSKVLVPIEFN